MKQEETQLNCTRNLEKSLPHQPLLPPFLVLTAQDSSMHRLVSLAICVLTPKVDQMVLIDYDGPRRISIEIFSGNSSFMSTYLMHISLMDIGPLQSG